MPTKVSMPWPVSARPLDVGSNVTPATHWEEGDPVPAGAAVEQIVAEAAAEIVVAVSAEQNVVAARAAEVIVAVAPGEEVGAVIADELVVMDRAGDVLDRDQGVVAVRARRAARRHC